MTMQCWRDACSPSILNCPLHLSSLVVHTWARVLSQEARLQVEAHAGPANKLGTIWTELSGLLGTQNVIHKEAWLLVLWASYPMERGAADSMPELSKARTPWSSSISGNINSKCDKSWSKWVKTNQVENKQWIHMYWKMTRNFRTKFQGHIRKAVTNAGLLVITIALFGSVFFRYVLYLSLAELDLTELSWAGGWVRGRWIEEKREILLFLLCCQKLSHPLELRIWVFRKPQILFNVLYPINHHVQSILPPKYLSNPSSSL